MAKAKATKKAPAEELKKPAKSVKKEEVKEAPQKAEEPVKTEQVEETKAQAVEATPAPEKAAKAEKSTKPVENPQTMEELLSMSGYALNVPKPGEVMSGIITDISKKMVLVDIGGKTEGMVVDKEFEAAKDFIDDLHIGDEVSVYILSPENDRGQILLSLKRALIDRKWEQFSEYLSTGEGVEVKGLEVNKGGMIVLADSIRGFVPSSQFGKEYLGRMENLIGKSFRVKVIEVDKEKNRLIFSERHVSEAEEIAKKSEALKYVIPGNIYEGVVSGIMPFGVFVGVEVPLEGTTSVGKVEGLVHISEISWEKVNDPNDYFKLGDRIKVKVLGVDENAGKLNLSVKQLSDDPWTFVEQKYPTGAKVMGKVSRTAPFGAFVTLEPGVDGLIHISKIPSGEDPKVGEEVEVYVENVDAEQRRMSLGMVLTEVPMGYK